MTQTQQIAQVVAAVMAQMGNAKRKYPAVKAHVAYKAKSKASVDPVVDRRLARLAKIARGFKKMGVSITFDQVTGRFDNVKPYKLWLADGRIVRKGQHGVSGMFHVSQTDVLPVMTKPEMTADVIQLTQPVA